jgi:hypothetical protein
MSDAPKRGRGRPRKHATVEDALLAKLENDRVRLQKLTINPTVESGQNEPAIAPTLAFISPITIHTDPSGPSSSAAVPIKDSAPLVSENESPLNLQFEDDDFPSASASASSYDYGGHTVDGSGGRHIDEDIYEVSDGDQEVRRPSSETTQFQDHDQGQDQGFQEFQSDLDYQDDLGEEDIDQLATHLGKQSLNLQGSPRKSPRESRPKSRTAKPADSAANPAADSVAASQLEVANRLAEQFYSFHSRTDDAHNACDAEYTHIVK